MKRPEQARCGWLRNSRLRCKVGVRNDGTYPDISNNAEAFYVIE
ncbi:BPSL0067 family protein [Enterobacter sp. ENT03]|nr:BPSL0067 family protein [Enterobacter sp. ENT03]